ncbi:MAG: hypothetical protein DRI90_05380 [Deltaproteobacteria bacterium]|nr:MAG: hypothetical protein DRI90_05380 [Deltaproteobacteria bacterium]
MLLLSRFFRFVHLVALAAILLACSSDEPAGRGGYSGVTGGTGGIGGTGGTGGMASGGSASGGSGAGGSATGGSGAGGALTFDCSTDPNWATASATLEAQLLAGINAQRGAGATCGTIVHAPVAELTLNTTLRDVARCWVKSMGDEGWFAHTRPDGLTIFDAVTSLYGKPQLAAPIAMGQSTAAEVLTGFMQGETTCALVMHASATTIGVGHYAVGDHWMVLMAD